MLESSYIIYTDYHLKTIQLDPLLLGVFHMGLQESTNSSKKDSPSRPTTVSGTSGSLRPFTPRSRVVPLGRRGPPQPSYSTSLDDRTSPVTRPYDLWTLHVLLVVLLLNRVGCGCRTRGSLSVTCTRTSYNRPSLLFTGTGSYDLITECVP